jgi:hypothetical protein
MADVDLTIDQIPKYYNIIYKKVAKFPASTSAGALGADTNGVLIHNFTNDGFVASIKISTSDASNNGVFLYVKDGTDIMPEGIVSVPLNSGNSLTVASVDGLANAGVTSRGDWIERNGKRVIPVAAGQDFKCSLQTATAGGEELYVTCTIFEKE